VDALVAGAISYVAGTTEQILIDVLPIDDPFVE
jgi:hypothetical protein